MKGIKMIFISYIKEKRGFIGVQVIFILIFAIVFTLYSLPLATVLYGGLLCGFAVWTHQIKTPLATAYISSLQNSATRIITIFYILKWLDSPHFGYIFIN